MTENAIISTTPMQLIDNAVTKGVDTDQLEKLLALQERWEANESRKAYSNSMVDVHQEMPVVAKALHNNHTKSDYASLDAIINQTKQIYTNHGFSISFHEGDTEKENHTRVCADVIHRSGHKETYHYDMPLDGVGIGGKVNMTAIHAKASSITYARRYLMCMVFNIPTGDDTDGNMPQECIDEAQLAEIKALAEEVNQDLTNPKILKYYKVNDFSELKKNQFQSVIDALEELR